jgi:hypothetical protein
MNKILRALQLHNLYVTRDMSSASLNYVSCCHYIASVTTEWVRSTGGVEWHRSTRRKHWPSTISSTTHPTLTALDQPVRLNSANSHPTLITHPSQTRCAAGSVSDRLNWYSSGPCQNYSNNKNFPATANDTFHLSNYIWIHKLPKM